MDKKLLDILVCPICKGKLVYKPKAGELICTMKRSTIALDRAPLDYDRDENAPVAYLPRF
jgi:hypothetical protein